MGTNAKAKAKAKMIGLTTGDRVMDDMDTTGTVHSVSGRVVQIRWDYGQTESVDTKMVDLTKIS